MAKTEKVKMTAEDAARIQSAEAKKNGGKVEKGSFAARAQAAAAALAKQEEMKKEKKKEK
jgi:hypothetical protein